MRILVLGGNGFIGTHLVELMSSSGARVRVLDRAGSLQSHPAAGVEYRYTDFDDIAGLTESLADVDVVIHLISTTVPGTANLDPVADIEGNLIGSVRLLQQMRNAGVQRLVFLSSGGTVYGNAKSLPIPEEHERNPLSSYGIVKTAIESYISMHRNLWGLSALVVRASNPFGPRQRHLGVQGAIPTFFQRALDGEEIKIWGDGSAVRDYIYISDLVSFILEGVRRNLSGVFNVGSGVGTSLNEILKLITEVSGITPVVRYLSPREFDVKDVVLDISKARRESDWTPRVPLVEGFQHYWRWLNGVDA